jgi:hypothetical protein
MSRKALNMQDNSQATEMIETRLLAQNGVLEEVNRRMTSAEMDDFDDL